MEIILKKSKNNILYKVIEISNKRIVLKNTSNVIKYEIISKHGVSKEEYISFFFKKYSVYRNDYSNSNIYEILFPSKKITNSNITLIDGKQLNDSDLLRLYLLEKIKKYQSKEVIMNEINDMLKKIKF